jgi:hypothetical protein
MTLIKHVRYSSIMSYPDGGNTFLHLPALSDKISHGVHSRSRIIRFAKFQPIIRFLRHFWHFYVPLAQKHKKTRMFEMSTTVEHLMTRRNRTHRVVMVRKVHLTGTSTNSSPIELCYNCRYAEENGRGRGDPWSLRQMGVYNSYDGKSQKSIWIILQPSSHIIESLQTMAQSLLTESMILVNAYLSIHVSFLASIEWNWHPYLENLRSRLDEIVS